MNTAAIGDVADRRWSGAIGARQSVDALSQLLIAELVGLALSVHRALNTGVRRRVADRTASAVLVVHTRVDALLIRDVAHLVRAAVCIGRARDTLTEKTSLRRCRAVR